MKKIFLIWLPILLIVSVLSGCIRVNEDHPALPPVDSNISEDLNSVDEPSLPAPVDDQLHGDDFLPTGWPIYENIEYKFQISYPEQFNALDNADSLYGWENGIVLFYDGGQAFNIVIQWWNSEEEIESKFPGMMEQVVTYKVYDKFLTIFNITGEPQFEEIVNSFRVH